MHMTSSFLGGFLLGGALIVAIGAQNAFVLRQGLRREHVGLVVAFCFGADVALMTAGVAGLGTALGASPLLARGLALAGAAYLAAFGLAALRRAARSEAALLAGAGAPGLSARGALAAVAGFTLLNPHVWLDTVVLLGTVGAAQPPALRPAFLLGACTASAAWFLALGYGARLLAPLFARPAAWRALDAAIGAVMLLLAAGLVASVAAPA
jgi:L-lysine exporter family protein LysE/ArgO